MSFMQRAARVARAPFDAYDAWGAPQSVKVALAVGSVMGLATYQVLYGKSKGQTLSQERPEALINKGGKGPRDLQQEKEALRAAAK